MIDLSQFGEGLITMRSGEQGYTTWFPNDDGTFRVRFESGWYCDYGRDGKRLTVGTIIHGDGSEEIIYPPDEDPRDIVVVQKCRRTHDMQWGFPP